MKHPVLNKTAVLSNSLSNSVAATESARKYYFARNKKIQNQIVIQLKSSVKMAKSDEATETKVATKKNSGGNKEKQKPPTKIVIRHLPPTMSEEEFLKQIDPLPPHDFYYFASADWSLGFDATCRAYMTLKNYDDVFLFRDRFDGYVFVDAKGNEYAAIVEFAPFQGILKNKSRRSDNKVNTIEEEAHYQQFLLKLAEEREIASKGGETKMEFNLNAKKEEITSTPLLQYLANKKEKRRLEAKKRVEEKRKQRDEEKEKRRQTTQTQIQTQDNVKETQVAVEVVVKKSVGEIEEKQNSRSKRRIERNQKRQEAFLQRKMQDKAAKSSESAEQVAVTEKTEQTQQREKKESRRERDRERERERNRLRRERREKAKELAKGNNDVIKVTPKILTKQDGETAKKKEKEKEAITVNRQNSPERSEAKCDEETKKQQRAAEERRIRNKDRPSIAIYQPKARLRQSEESDTGGNNSAGGRQSDGERLAETKKAEETTQVKKVSRYSERRKRSATKEKRKSSATDEEIVTKEDAVSSLTEAQ